MMIIRTSGYVKEVNDWLNSTECSTVFENLKLKLLEEIDGSRNRLNATKNDAIYVYLAADNEQVKEAFEEKLKIVRYGIHNMTINVMRVETKFVQHIKNLEKMKASTNNEGESISRSAILSVGVTISQSVSQSVSLGLFKRIETLWRQLINTVHLFNICLCSTSFEKTVIRP